VGVVIMVNAGMSSVGWMWLVQMVAGSVSRLVKLCTGWLSSVRLRALASAVSERWAAATGSARSAWAAGLSLSTNRIEARALVR
jgi:hypothetical protein